VAHYLLLVQEKIPDLTKLEQLDIVIVNNGIVIAFTKYVNYRWEHSEVVVSLVGR
jgi:hypothetical protein